MKSAFRRPRALWVPLRRVARSDRSNLTASKGGVAANMASSRHFAMSLATHRHLTLGLAMSPLLWSTHLPPMGFLPVRLQASERGTTSQTPQDFMKSNSSLLAFFSSSGAIS